MPKFTRFRVLIIISVVCSVVIGIGLKTKTEASKRAAMAASVSSTMTAALAHGGDATANGLVNPGDTIRYTATITNGAPIVAGNDAANVIFTDTLPSDLTLVSGSLKAAPVAADDAFPVTGNVRIQKTAGTLLSNDFNPLTNSNANFAITAFAGDASAPFVGTTAQGGNITATAGDGAFEYNPPAGYEGTDSFTYTVTDMTTGLTGTGTVTFTVSGMIWFVDSAQASNGDGRLGTPFNCLVGAGCFSVSANDPNDNIFLYSGSYTGGLTLKNGQKLIGQGATSALTGAGSITGISPASGSDALPVTGGVNPTITTVAAATNGITLGQNNTLRGLTVGNTTGAKLFGNLFGTLTAGSTAGPDVTLNGTGSAMTMSTGSFAASSAFTSVSGTGPGRGILFGTIGGTVSLGSTSFDGTSDCINLGQSTVNINFGNTTCTNATNIGVQLGGANTAGTRTFGTLSIGSAGWGFIHTTNGGNVTVTGAASITASGLQAIWVTGDSAAAAINFNGPTTLTTTGAADTGMLWDGTTAGVTATFASLTVQTLNGRGLDLSGGGTLNVTSPTGTINNTVQPNSAIVANGVALNANFAAIKSSAGSSGSVSLTNVTGTSNFGGGTLTTNNAVPVFVVNGGSASVTYSGDMSEVITQPLLSVSNGHTGTLTFNTGTLSATQGSGLQFDNADGTYNFNGTTTLNGGDAGIDITNGSAGTFSFGANTSITGPSAGASYNEDTSTANVTYNGTITQNNAQNAVNVNAKSGGATLFQRPGGSQVTASTSTAGAVDLTNSGGTVTFTGGLAITTTSGVGFNATGGGTVTATQNNTTIVNTLSTTTGTALNVANTHIGASGLTFRSISAGTAASGPVKGINLDTTGASGGLTVTGTGSASSGGTIQRSTYGVFANSTVGMSLSWMNITNNGLNQTVTGADSNCGGNMVVNGNLQCVANVYMTSVTGASFSNDTITGSSQQGINGSSVSGLTITNSTISGNGNESFESGILMRNTSGTVAITGSNIIDNRAYEMNMFNNTGSMTLNTSASSYGRTAVGSAEAQAGLLLTFDGNSNTTINATTLTLSNNTGVTFNNAFWMNVQGAAIVNGSLTASKFDNNAASVVVTANNTSQVTFNTMNNGDGGAVNTGMTRNALQAIVYGVLGGGSPLPTANLTGTISGNHIGSAAGLAGCGTGQSCHGIDVNSGTDWNGQMHIRVDSNFVQQVTGGIIATIDGAVAGNNPRVDLRVVNNTVNNPLGAAGEEAIKLNGATTSTHPNLTLGWDVSGNSVAGHWANGSSEASVYLRNRFTPAGSVILPSYGGGAADDTAVQNYLAGRNTISAPGGLGVATLVTHSNTNPFVNGVVNTPITPPAFEPLGEAASVNIEMEAPLGEMASVDVEISPSDLEKPLADAEMSSSDRAKSLADDVIAPAIGAMAEVEIRRAAVENQPSTFEMIAEIAKRAASEISPTVLAQEAVPEFGETVTVNGGSAAGFTIPAGKSVTIYFDATVKPVGTISPTVFSVSNQGSTSGTGFGPVLTDGDPGVAGAQPTVTTVVQPETISKAFNPTTMVLDGQSTLTFTISNANPATAATGITFTDVFPTTPGAMVVASPLTASTTCAGGTLQDSAGGALAAGDVGIRLVGGTLAANGASCTVSVKVSVNTAGTYNNTSQAVSSTEGAVGLASNTAPLTVSIFTASGVSVSGRILSADGRGLRSTRVVLTDSTGMSRVAITGTRGNYRFDDVPAGQTYTLSVESRRFVFVPRVISVTDELTDQDFVAEPYAAR